MDIIRYAITRPVAVISAVLLVVLFGLVALNRIPIQLAPDVSRPVITVQTNWAGASPVDIEREIVNRQEEALSGLDNLKSMVSTSSQGRGSIELEFAVSADMNKALLLVSNRLDRVGGYPDEASEPTLKTSGSEDNAIAWFIVLSEDETDTDMHRHGNFMEDIVGDRLQRVDGVGGVNVYGGSDKELAIKVDPLLLAEHRITVPEIVARLRAANVALSAGDIDEGKRRYVVRTDSELNTPADVRSVVLRAEPAANGGPQQILTLGDIADVDYGYKEPGARIRFKGTPGLAFNLTREIGANVIRTMEGIKAAVAELQETEFARRGLRVQQVYDETVYINSAIDLVVQNIWIGGILAAIILLLFLRSPQATLIISIAIPVAVVGSFVAMSLMGRSLNVISLAGIAFAVGMVVDAAIVVLENIYRLREQGKGRFEAAWQGAHEVWGAILVSALTTVLVFAPIMIMELEVGQLFRDIAVAISVSVLLSLLVAITVIPALSNWLLKGKEGQLSRVKIPGIDHFAAAFVRLVLTIVKTCARAPIIAILLIVVVTSVAGYASWRYLPKLEYLPEGNRNLIFGMVLPPPGYNQETMNKIGDRIEDEVSPLWADDYVDSPETTPKIERFFFVTTPTRSFLGAVAEDETRVSELIGPMQRPIFKEPGTFGFISQPSIFGRGVGGARAVALDVSGPDLAATLGVAQRAAGLIGRVMSRSEGHQMRPKPGLELGAPEIRVKPNLERLAEAGVSVRNFGMTLDSFNDGLRVAEITDGSQRIDLVLRGDLSQQTSTQSLDRLPIITPEGAILPVSALADSILTSGPTSIRHIERQRTVTLEVRPAANMPLEVALDTLKTEVIDVLRQQELPEGTQMRLSGTADKLDETWQAMVLDLVLALAIVFLVMAILFESFIFPLIILLSVPVAAAGGVAGLVILNLFYRQSLDMLTLLGFVILVGIVVNNAILLVHQTLLHIDKDRMDPTAAILEATSNRIRPIFMSTLTSVFGMLPLVLLPGAGSELYRGLGSVVVGGLSLSALLTLLLIPAMLVVVRPLLALRLRKA